MWVGSTVPSRRRRVLASHRVVCVDGIFVLRLRRRRGRRGHIVRLALRRGPDHRRKENRVQVRRAVIRGGAGPAPERAERRHPSAAHGVARAPDIAQLLLALRDRDERPLHGPGRLVGRARGVDRRVADRRVAQDGDDEPVHALGFVGERQPREGSGGRRPECAERIAPRLAIGHECAGKGFYGLGRDHVALGDLGLGSPESRLGTVDPAGRRRVVRVRALEALQSRHDEPRVDDSCGGEDRRADVEPRSVTRRLHPGCHRHAPSSVGLRVVDVGWSSVSSA